MWKLDIGVMDMGMGMRGKYESETDREDVASTSGSVSRFRMKLSSACACSSAGLSVYGMRGESGGLLDAREAVVREGVENSVSEAKREQSVSEE